MLIAGYSQPRGRSSEPEERLHRPGKPAGVSSSSDLCHSRGDPLYQTNRTTPVQGARSRPPNESIAEVVPHERVHPRAIEIAEALATRPQLLNRYLATTIRQRLARRMAEGTVLGMAVEGITAANMPYLDQG